MGKTMGTMASNDGLKFLSLGSLQSNVHKLKSDMREVKAAAFTADEKDKVLSAADSDTALTIAKMT
jgi:hypothetical protein